MSVWSKLLAALAGTSATLSQNSSGTTSLVAGLVAIFLGLFTATNPTSAQAHAETATQALKANNKI